VPWLVSIYAILSLVIVTRPFTDSSCSFSLCKLSPGDRKLFLSVFLQPAEGP